jgi:hypothetical protein
MILFFFFCGKDEKTSDDGQETEIFRFKINSHRPSWIRSKSKYRTRAIITRGLYIFYPLFGSQKRVFKEVFSEKSVLMYG